MAKKKPGPKPEDRSVYFEEARELRRLFPKLSAHAAGIKIAKTHPEVKGLDQAIRKALKKEERAAATAPITATPPSPSTPTSSGARPRKRLKRLQDLGMSPEQLQLHKLQAERAAFLKQVLDHDLRMAEALKSDLAFMELLRRLYDGED